MNSITQGVIGSLIAAAIVGTITYAFIVNKNSLQIETLSGDIESLETALTLEKEKTSNKLQKNADAINEIKLLIARSFPSREYISISATGAKVSKEIPPLETAVIVSAANVVNEIKKVGNSDNPEKAKLELEKARLEYESLLSIAKEDNPDIEVNLKEFNASTPAPMQKDVQLVKAHQEIGDTNKIIKASTGISVKDLEKHGIAGGKNSEVNKAGRAIGKVFGW